MSHTEPTSPGAADLHDVYGHPERGFVLRLPPDGASMAIARSAIRRTIRFRTDDLESRYCTAFTEVLINAIEAEQRLSAPDDVLVVAMFDHTPGVAVINRSDGTDHGIRNRPTDRTFDLTDLRGRGLLIATSLVPSTEIVFDGSTVVVVLPLEDFGSPS